MYLKLENREHTSKYIQYCEVMCLIYPLTYLLAAHVVQVNLGKKSMLAVMYLLRAIPVLGIAQSQDCSVPHGNYNHFAAGDKARAELPTDIVG